MSDSAKINTGFVQRPTFDFPGFLDLLGLVLLEFLRVLSPYSKKQKKITRNIIIFIEKLSYLGWSLRRGGGGREGGHL